MSAFIIVNPRATAIDRNERDYLIRAIQEIMPVEVADTTHRGHATSLASHAMRNRSADVVIGIGGDGTMNEIANGLLDDGPHKYVPTLGVIPAGATNVFARSLGFPNSPRLAARLLQNSIRHQLRREINLGSVNGRYFLFSAGIGFDAAIIDEVERRRSAGARSTLSLTVTTAIRNLFRSDWPTLKLGKPGRVAVGGLRWIIVTKTDTWTFLNQRPLRPTPRASFQLGMDVYARRRVSPVGVLWSTAEFIRQKPNGNCSEVHLEHDLGEFTVVADDLAPVHVDGDPLGRHRGFHFLSVPGGIRVFAPDGSEGIA